MRVAATTTVLALAALFTGCVEPPAIGDPLRGLTPEQLEQFEQGRIEFARAFTPETGLGPLFNANSCIECHEDPVAGGPGDEVEFHVSALLPGPFCDLFAEQGGPVIQQEVTPALLAALGIEKEPVPAGAAVASRTTPDILGFGLLDAVPDETILALADPDDTNGDGISGRPNRFFDGRLGRFGRKALIPTLSEFNRGAFVIEQGITNPSVLTEESIGGQPIPAGVDPLPEPEIDQGAIERTDAFVAFLAPPSPKKLSIHAKHGRKIFGEIGCAACHVPHLKTGDHPVKALRHKQVAAYTDLLLHDMGPELADICFGLAGPSEFRTEPLMGLRLNEQIGEGEARFLHDGRAATVEEAILFHGGEAASAREKFKALPDKERKALLEFLRSL